jgi:4-hydroxymandelate oxidase
MAQAPTWDDLHWLRQQTSLPLVVKGILHPDDAVRAVQAGCDGLVVSSHGGRVMSGTPSPLQALPAIVQRVGTVPVLVDSGIRSGRDVLVALASGATAVMVGRPLMWALAAQGALGVAKGLRILRDELEMHMALTGCRHLQQINDSLIA